ncbi:unnamed protein product [Camellia sinensis]
MLYLSLPSAHSRARLWISISLSLSLSLSQLLFNIGRALISSPIDFLCLVPGDSDADVDGGNGFCLSGNTARSYSYNFSFYTRHPFQLSALYFLN